MKSILTIYLIVLFATSYSQDTLIDPIEIPAEFPGGQNSLFCHIEKHLDYTKLWHLESTGRLFIFFIVESDGTLNEIKINPKFVHRFSNLIIDSIVNSEFTRLFREMPKWKPAIIFDTPVRSNFSVPIQLPYSNFKCPDLKTDDNIITDPDILPYFQVGKGKTNKERLTDYIYANLEWPRTNAECKGWVFIQAIIEKTGEITNTKIIRHLCPGFDDEALRVVNHMPDWKPGIKNGEPVRTVTVIPIEFVLR